MSSPRPTAAVPADAVASPALLAATVMGAGGATLTIDFDDAWTRAAALPMLNAISAGIASAQLLAYVIGTAAALPAGTIGVLQVDQSAGAALPDGYAALICDAAAPVHVTGGSAPNETIVAGIGGLTMVAGTGSGTAVAGGGNNFFYAALPAAGNWQVAFGNGADTVVALTGNDTIAPGLGANIVFLGSGADLVTATGTDTVVAGSGAATVAAGTGSTFLFQGSGPLQFIGGGGVSTVAGHLGGTATLLGGAGRQLDLVLGNTLYEGGSGADTVAAFHGHLTVAGGSGPGLFVGSPDGGNVISAGSGSATMFGRAGGDVLSAFGSAGDVIAGGVGAETITGAGSTGPTCSMPAPGRT